MTTKPDQAHENHSESTPSTTYPTSTLRSTQVTRVKPSGVNKWFVYITLGLCVVFLFGILVRLANGAGSNEESGGTVSAFNDYEYTVIEGDEFSENSILSVPVSGLILTEPVGDLGLFEFFDEGAVTYGYEVKEQLRRAAEDESIKAIVLEVNSPGGTVGGANAISDGIEYYQQVTGNPVYTHITDLGASGGYWIAATTDMIFAETGSAVGSIGVIMGPFVTYNDVVAEGGVFGGVQTEGGIDYRYFTGGEYKDTGSPYRPLTEEEEEHWQTVLSNEYAIFVDHIARNRDLTPAFIRETVKAFPYETVRALELGLIDSIGSREDTYFALMASAGIPEDDYNVIQEEELFGFFDSLFSAEGLISWGSGAREGAAAKIPGCVLCNRPLVLYDRTYSLMSF